jgi:hypothetical protein
VPGTNWKNACKKRNWWVAPIGKMLANLGLWDKTLKRCLAPIGKMLAKSAIGGWHRLGKCLQISACGMAVPAMQSERSQALCPASNRRKSSNGAWHRLGKCLQKAQSVGGTDWENACKSRPVEWPSRPCTAKEVRLCAPLPTAENPQTVPGTN